jgi:hypothetical protein
MKKHTFFNRRRRLCLAILYGTTPDSPGCARAGQHTKAF